MTGRILNLGADWQTVFADGVAELDTRYAIETDAGHTIEVKNFGYRHGAPEVIAAWPGVRILTPRTITCAHMPF